jgi:hypothetical protein
MNDAKLNGVGIVSTTSKPALHTAPTVAIRSAPLPVSIAATNCWPTPLIAAIAAAQPVDNRAIQNW